MSSTSIFDVAGDNLLFFRSVWSATLFFFAQQAAKQRESNNSWKTVHKQFGNQLAFTMMLFPEALQVCHIDKEHEEMLLDAVKSFGAGIRFHLTYPNQHVPTEHMVEEDIKNTVKFWSERQWYRFGLGLGKILQEALHATFAQKYVVDGNGALHRRVLEAPEVGLGGKLAGQSSRFLVGSTQSLFLLATVLLVAIYRTRAAHWRRWLCSGGPHELLVQNYECAPADPVDADTQAVQ